MPVIRSLRILGKNIRIARLDKNLPQSVIAERAGISVRTLMEIEKGSPTVELGNVAAVLSAVGFGYPFEDLLSPSRDVVGTKLEEMRLPQRVRK